MGCTSTFFTLSTDCLKQCADRTLQSQQLVNGRTGNVSFNSAGDRVNAVYEIVNIQTSGSVVVGNCSIDSVS